MEPITQNSATYSRVLTAVKQKQNGLKDPTVINPANKNGPEPMAFGENAVKGPELRDSLVLFRNVCTGEYFSHRIISIHFCYNVKMFINKSIFKSSFRKITNDKQNV